MDLVARMDLVVLRGSLRKDSTNSNIGCIYLYNKLSEWVRESRERSGGESLLKLEEGLFGGK